MAIRSALRLFVALYPPPELARTLPLLLDPLSLPAFRTTREEQVHLTLYFVGDTDPRQVDTVLESVRRSASGIGPITLTPRSLVSLPERGPPRLVALEVDSSANLMEFQRRLAHRLSRRADRGHEHFLPHFTLCRFVMPGGTPLRVLTSVASFVVERAAVVQSVLHPGGAEHRALAHVPLA